MSQLSHFLRMNKWKVVLEKKVDDGWVQTETIHNQKTWMGLIWYLWRSKEDSRIVLYRNYIGEED